MADLKTYRGNCHCGAFVFEVRCPEITTVLDCTCSICVKKAYCDWIPLVELGNYTIIKGSEDDLTSYSFGNREWEHMFCPVCGSGVVGRKTVIKDGELGRAFNARSLQDMDPWTLSRKHFDGASVGAPYSPPAYTGPEPEHDDDPDGRVYTGSCHCGAITLRLWSKPLDTPDITRECNCSICTQIGYMWTYPNKKHLAIQGTEHMARYAFGERHLEKTFCRTCGIHITNDWRNLDDAEQATMNDGKRKFYLNFGHFRPLNVRTLNDFDVATARPTRMTTGKTMGGEYVKP